MTSRRPTTGPAYTDGRGAFRPEVERVVDGAAITDRRVVRADVCVIGTGAGGAPVAKELAEGGLRVVMLEDGRHFPTDDFTARPREMAARLYRDAGQVSTIGNARILLPLGRTVGGSTTVNSGTCFRTPDPVLALWADRFGLVDLAPPGLEPFFRRVERELNVAQVPAELAGRNALLVKRGAERLGWSGDFIYRNARGCVGSGVCTFGCPTSAKQHAGLTYVARAWEAGAETYADCAARRIVVGRGRARAVEARTGGGGRLRVECDVVVVACGAVHTPLLLRRSGLGGRSGELGRNLSIHPATAVRARFDEEVDMATGVPQSYYVDEFADERIMLEGAAGPPDYLAMGFSFSGERHRELMLSYRHLSQFGVMVSDLSRGSVRPRAGRAVVRYDLGPDDLAALERGVDLLTELYWAAGARAVYRPYRGAPDLRDGERQPRRRPVRASDLILMAFHPLGTARADADRSRGVLDPNLRLHDAAGVYVSDASAVPSSIGVNPQITIMALATRLAYHLLGRRPPVDEPEPESIARPRAPAVHRP